MAKRLAEAILSAFTLCLLCCGGKTSQVAGDSKKDQAEPLQKEEKDMLTEAKKFLDEYNSEYSKLEKPYTLASWNASNSGTKEAFDMAADAELALKKMHSDKQMYQKIVELRKYQAEYDPLTIRSLEVAEPAFKENQLPSDILEKMVKASKEIEQVFNTYRPEVGQKKMTNNDLLELLAKETNSKKRKMYWEGLKQVGGQVADKLVALAKIRNEVAKILGYDNFWEMRIKLQEHDPGQLIAIFDELEKLTNEPFKKMKEKMDAELTKRFRIKEMKPWHYDNPFFQEAPPSDKVDLDDFYKNKKKEDIVEIAKKFYRDIGLPCDEIVANSDLYEREGKDQHAFCTCIDRGKDVRTLLNIKPTAAWMDTTLHEEGHAVYSIGIDSSLPFNLRDSAHIFTTEAVAMLLGALGKNSQWMVEYAGADPKKVDKVKDAILEQRRREQLIFARWALVMFSFERALYENPDQDLNKLWWDTVERLQMVSRPENRNEPDWAAKPHFTIAPVYYHNYLLGEVLAAQLRHTLAKLAGHEGSSATLSFNGRKDFGTFLQDKVFKPGMSVKWPVFVENATSEPLTPKYYAEEIK